MKPIVILAVLALTPVIFVACGKSKEEQQAEAIQKSAEQLQQGAEAAAKGLSDLAAGLSSAVGGDASIKPVDPVSFRDLIALLPAPPDPSTADALAQRMQKHFVGCVDCKQYFALRRSERIGTWGWRVLSKAWEEIQSPTGP